MPLDYQQLQEDIHKLGEEAVWQEAAQKEARQAARELLDHFANQQEKLRLKVERAVQEIPNLRCATPRKDSQEALDAGFSVPQLPDQGTLIAADGSQINPDRHAEVNYCLVNVGAIQMQIGTGEAPIPGIQSRLIYGDQLATPSGGLTDNLVALMRDLGERKVLVELSAQALTQPVITFTDGPLGLSEYASDPGVASEFQEKLREYIRTLTDLCELGVTTAGYIDKPASNLVIRLLEVAVTPDDQLASLRTHPPLKYASDLNIFSALLEPGERSAVYAMQSRLARHYSDELGLNFFYLHTGRDENPIARVEIPEWVAGDSQKLDALHAVLVQQCRALGGRAYPYLLHRAHETAVVSFDEKNQLTNMILMELRRRGLEVGVKSSKAALKELPRRKR